MVTSVWLFLHIIYDFSCLKCCIIFNKHSQLCVSNTTDTHILIFWRVRCTWLDLVCEDGDIYAVSTNAKQIDCRGYWRFSNLAASSFVRQYRIYMFETSGFYKAFRFRRFSSFIFPPTKVFRLWQATLYYVNNFSYQNQIQLCKLIR